MRRNITGVAATFLVAAVGTTAVADKATEMAMAVELGWPDWRGPFHRSGIDGGHDLINDLHEAKLVWKSEEPIRHKYDLGYAACSAWPGGACGHSGPIYWDGSIYVNFCQPHHRPWPEGRDGQRNGMRDARLVDCDEIIIRMDAATGKTLWKAVFEKIGVNYAWGKAGAHFVPVIRYGNIYAITSGGYARCLDAKTGEEQWSRELPAAASVRKYKENVREDSNLRTRGGPNRGMCRNPAVAGGVAAFMGGGTSGSCTGGPLIGFDAHTGKKLWEGRVAGIYCSPVVWRPSPDKEYFINGYACLDPKSGKEVWQIDNAKSGTSHTTAIGEHEGVWYLLAPGRPRTDLSYVRNHISLAKRRGKTLPQYNGNQCFRITPDGAELAWELPDQYGCNATPAMYKGKVYFDSPKVSEEHEVAKWNKLLCRADLVTGELEAEIPSGNRHFGSMAIADGWVHKPTAEEHVAGHGRGHRGFRSDADGLTALGGFWKVSHMEGGTPIIVDGRLYHRGLDAIYCHDLRQSPPGAPTSQDGDSPPVE